jgi:hypothetical protein
MLYSVKIPNGTLVSIGNLGVNVDADSGLILETSTTAFALLKVNNVTGIYTINTVTGAATKWRFKYSSYCNGCWFRFLIQRNSFDLVIKTLYFRVGFFFDKPKELK